MGAYGANRAQYSTLRKLNGKQNAQTPPTPIGSEQNCAAPATVIIN